MDNPNSIANETRELYDIVQDYRKTNYLLNSGRTDELESHMRSMQLKYFAEMTLHNLTARIPPRNIQENALNFMIFLKALLQAKGIQDISEHLKTAFNH